MKFRWKMLILLLTVSLTPLVIIAASYYFAALQLGSRVATDTHGILTETAQDFLFNLVDDYSRILSRDREILELMLTVQAREITRKLAEPPVESPTIIFNRDYRKGFSPPQGMVPSLKHGRPDSRGQVRPGRVSYDHQVYFLVKGTDPGTVADDMARLSTMPQVYKSIYQIKSDMILWQYMGLENGLQINYPGAEGFPPDFDQRKRDWYKMAKAAGKLVWGPPVVDALTGITVLTISMPIFREDNSFAGVTAIDVLVPGIFQELRLPAKWSARARTALVSPFLESDFGDPKLVVSAQMSYLNLEQNWQTPVALEFIRSRDRSELSALIQDVMDGRSGVRKMEFNGSSSLWAYGESEPGNTFPLVIVPYDAIVAQATHTRQLVFNTTRKAFYITGVILVVVASMAAFLAVIVSRRITGPLTRLSGAARKFSQGRYDTRVNISTGDELQSLGDVFNSMGKELKLRQKQLVQADKMASLGILVAGVAHEINNPNSLILLNISQLQRAWEDLGPILDEYYLIHGDFHAGGLLYSEIRSEIRQMLEDTHDRARRIKRIVNDLKDFARKDGLKSPEAVELNQVARVAARLVDNSIKKATHRFVLCLGPHLPPFQGIPQRIEQVIVNLLLNACQVVTDKKAQILLQTRYQASDNTLVLEVIDQGCGIAPEHMTKLTDPFFTTRRDQGGTGLGLFISAGIAGEHHGRLEFESRKGRGTCARLVLPAQKRKMK